MLIKILQIKIDRHRKAHHSLAGTANEKKADKLLVQELNRTQVQNNPARINDLNMDTAILCNNTNCGIEDHTRGVGYICFDFSDWSLYNCYISSNITLQQYKSYVDTVMPHARRNCVEWMNTPNMVSHNEETTPTFARGNQMLFIDLTVSSQGMATKVSGWRVFTEENISLHKTIFFNISTSEGQRKADWYPARHPNTAVLTTALEITEDNIKDPEQNISVVRNA
ncbi:hypothetical protein JTB14_038071 [Gonioctena quinquepunctata]|nr:hypothetical protein JTB14_038071 [Gonioctena quinquepunctata]